MSVTKLVKSHAIARHCSVSKEEAMLHCWNKSVITRACLNPEYKCNLHLMDACVGKYRVKVLRGIGCNGVVVRCNLLNELTG